MGSPLLRETEKLRFGIATKGDSVSVTSEGQDNLAIFHIGAYERCASLGEYKKLQDTGTVREFVRCTLVDGRKLCYYLYGMSRTPNAMYLAFGAWTGRHFYSYAIVVLHCKDDTRYFERWHCIGAEIKNVFVPNNQGFLVGVATNPGPAYTFSTLISICYTSLIFCLGASAMCVVFCSPAIYLLWFVQECRAWSVSCIVVQGLRVGSWMWLLHISHVVYEIYRNRLVPYWRTNDQGYLVGVEPNPGPNLLLHLLFGVWLPLSVDDFSVWRASVNFSVGCLFLRLQSRRLRKKDGEFLWLLYLWLGIGNIFAGLVHLYIAVSWIWALYRENNQGFLVGIEPNPGPKNSFIMACLRNAEKYSPPVPSTPQSKGGGRSARRQRQLELRKTKKKLMRRFNALDKESGASFYPESGLSLKVKEMSLGEDTKLFIESLVENLKNMISRMKPVIKVEVDWTTNVLVNIQRIFEWAKEHLNWFFNILKFCFNLLLSVAEDSWRRALGFLSEYFVFLPEAGVIDMCATTALYSSTIGKHIKAGDIFGVLRMLKSLSTTASSLAEVRQGVWKIVATLVLSINRWFGTGFKVATGHPRVDSLWERFRNIVQRLEGEGPDRYEMALCMYALMGDIQDAYRESDDADEKDQLRFLVNTVRPKYQDCEATINPNNGPRCEPLGVCIGGPTGSGKSTFTFPTLLALTTMIMSEYYPERFADFLRNHNGVIFYRHIINEFWDGLSRSHMVVVYDEFGQVRDAAGSPNTDAAEVLAMLNTAPMHLHYSAIADKAKHYANPKVVWCTTNRSRFDFNAIVCPKAVTRRFHVAAIQVPKAEYCVDPHVDYFERRLSLEKVRQRHPEREDDPDTWFVDTVQEYIAWDFDEACPKTGDAAFTLGFDDFVQLLWKTYQKVATKGNKILQYHTNIKLKYAAKVKPMPTLPVQHLVEDEPEYHSANSETASEAVSELDLDVHDNGDKVFMPGPTEVLGWFERNCLKLRVRYPSARNLFDPEVCKIVAGAMGTIAALFGAVKAYQWFTGSKPESGVAPKPKARPVRIRNTTKELNDGFANAMPESGVYDVLTRVLMRNTYRVYVDRQFMGFATMLRGRFGVMPRHFMDVSDDNYVLEFVNFYGGKTAMCVDSHKLEYTRMSTSYAGGDRRADLILFELPDVSRLHADIVKLFLDKSKFKKGDSFASAMPVLRAPANDPMRINAEVLVLSTQVNITSSVNYGDDYCSAYLSYYADTAPADCGALIFTDDKRLGGPKILGFHTGGASRLSLGSYFGTKACCGVAFLKDELEKCMHAFETFDENNYVDEEELAFDLQPEDGFKRLGTAPAPGQPGRSKIVHSPFHGELWEITTARSRLRPFEVDGVVIDPAQKAHEKYNTSNGCLHFELLNKAYEIVNKLVQKKNVPEPHKPRLLNTYEAIAGVDGVEFLDSINRKTSAGYPFVLGKKKSKTQWLGEEGKPDPSTPEYKELEAMVDRIVESAKVGKRLTHIYMDCLKDERRPLAKVASGSTRQFMACPAPLIVAMRRYYGDFLRHLCANRIHNGTAIGVNPHEEWGDVFKHLHPNDNYRHGAGDYQSYDAGVKSYVEWLVLKMAENFYATTSTKEDVRVRAVLFQEVVNSLHITPDGKVYEFQGKNPSGNVLTAELNSLTNAIYLVSCWLHNGIPAATIEEYFRWITGGDDHVTSFPAEWASQAGSIAVAKALKELYGYVYTDEAKGQDLVESKDIMDVTFYKRGFKVVKGRMRAPLDLGVLRETLNWQRRTSTKQEFEERVRNVLIELAQHGKKIFDENAPVILQACARHGVHTEFGTWADALDKPIHLRY